MVIGNLLDSIRKQDYPKKLLKVFVVADNCTDKTAEIAKNHGAIVLERFNDTEKGKGFALKWAFNQIFKMNKKYDAFCVFDADNVIEKNFLLEMNKHMCNGYRVVQGYIDTKNPFDSWITASYAIAFWTSNRLFQLARYYLGMTCSLCGTGFCVEADIIREKGWNATCLTEDLEFTMKLALDDIKVGWAHDAIVYDEKPLTLKQSWHQRIRWSQGFADCTGRFFFQLMRKAIKEKNLVAFDCATYLLQPLRILVYGIITVSNDVQL
jgi:cellulose synthase/poly-beta-1,6-N-acetylglucosamine synthase-like glycosyltransferase